MYWLLHTPKSFGLFAIRIAFAALILYHCAVALMLPQGAAADHAMLLQNLPLVAIVGELLAGTMLLVGLLSRVAAIGIGVIRVIALVGHTPIWPGALIESQLLVLMICLLFVFAGGGLFSLDRRLSRNLLP